MLAGRAAARFGKGGHSLAFGTECCAHQIALCRFSSANQGGIGSVPDLEMSIFPERRKSGAAAQEVHTFDPAGMSRHNRHQLTGAHGPHEDTSSLARGSQ